MSDAAARTKVERRICRIATPNKIVRVCSSLMVPLMIAVFTIVTTVIQMNLAQQQREQDLHIADENREKDERIDERRREKDLDIANQTRILQNQIEENRRAAEDNAQKDQQMNTVLAAYLKDTAELMLTRNFSLDDQTTGTVIRAKTLTSLGQLDGKRKGYLVRFLYEARMMNIEGPSIDLTDADLSDLDLTKYKLINASFAQCNLIRAIFRGSTLRNISFDNAQLNGALFDQSTLSGISFCKKDLTNTSFIGAQLDRVDHSGATVTMVNFTNSTMRNVIFAIAQLGGASFDRSELTDINFYDASLTNTSFIGARLSPANLHSAIITNADFTNVRASPSIWFSVSGENTIFNGATMENTNFTNSSLINASFAKTNLVVAHLDHSTLVRVNFTDANLLATNFASSQLSESIFDRSNAINTNFYRSILVGTTWADTVVRNVDFSQANLVDASITDAQIRRAWKTFDIILPNGKIGVDTNLLENGDAEGEDGICHTSPWHVNSMTVKNSNEVMRHIFGQCWFARQSNATQGRMSQRVRLPSQYSEWIRTNMALIWIAGYCICDENFVLHARQFNGNSTFPLVDHTHNISMDVDTGDVLFSIHPAMTEIELEITFVGDCRWGDSRGNCDNLKLAIWHRKYTLEQ